jgi:transposase
MGRKPYSDDLRARVVSAVGGGCSRHAAAERFAVSVYATHITWARTVANELAALPPLATHYTRLALTQRLRRPV